MSSPVRFGDHTSFHIHVLRVTLAGAALGLLGYVMGLILPLERQVVQTLGLVLAAAVLGLAACPPARRSIVTSVLLSLGIGLLGTLSYQALAGGSPRYEWFGIFVYGLTIGIVAGRDLTGSRRLILPLAMGLSTLAAAYVVQVFSARISFTQYVPAFVAFPAYGALAGFLVSVALIVKQLWIEQDPVSKEYQEIRHNLNGEMQDLCQRAMILYGQVREVLKETEDNGGDKALGKSLEKMVLRIFSLARKWQEVERQAGQTSSTDLGARVEELDRKIEGTSDPVAKKQYRLAREALGSQLRYLRDISRNRERVLAQVHTYLAGMERLRLAVLNHRGADAAKLSDEITPILEDIDEIGQEIDFASDAMSEVSEVSATASEPQVPEAAAAPSPEAKTAPTVDEAGVPTADPKDAAAPSAAPAAPDAESRLASRMFDE